MIIQVPLIDLKTNYYSLKKEIDKAILDVLENSQFILGPQLEDFENNFSQFTQTKFCVGVDSGISALELGMRALGIGKDDEVITPVNSFIASSSSISLTGAKPIWVDVNRENFNIDTNKIERKITKKTKAIMPVHLYGQSADVEKILEIAKKYELYVIEDACQSHGAEYKGKRVGSFGDFAAFSFYPGKNLGAYGDGGALVTKNKSIAKKVMQMRNYGQTEKYKHKYLSFNKRLDNLQAAILNVKLKYLDSWNEKRRKIAEEYINLLSDLPILLPTICKDNTHVFHQFVIKIKNRNELMNFLNNEGIETGLHYPTPIHHQPIYKDLGTKKYKYPVAESLSNEILSLPIFPEMTTSQVKYVSEKIKRFYKKQ